MATSPSQSNSSSHSVAHHSFFSWCHSPELSILVQQLFSKMLPNMTPKTYTFSFSPHLPCTPAFGHSHTPTSFRLTCEVNSSQHGQGPTSYSVFFISQHTEVPWDQRHFQIPVRSAQFFSLVTAISKLLFLSTTLNIYHCIFLDFV